MVDLERRYRRVTHCVIDGQQIENGVSVSGRWNERLHLQRHRIQMAGSRMRLFGKGFSIVRLPVRSYFRAVSKLKISPASSGFWLHRYQCSSIRHSPVCGEDTAEIAGAISVRGNRNRSVVDDLRFPKLFKVEEEERLVRPVIQLRNLDHYQSLT